MKKLLTLTFSLISLVGYSQSNTEKNYVKTVTARQATSSSIINSTDNSLTQQSIQYVDGLGRPLQSIVRWGSPNGEDIISQPGYDEFGRQTKSYLPIVTGQSSGNYYSDFLTDDFYESTLGFSSGDATKAYSETAFEPSPLNRTSLTLGAGEAWRNADLVPVDDFEDEEEINSNNKTLWITLFNNVEAGQTVVVTFNAKEQSGADSDIDLFNNGIKLPNANLGSFTGSFVNYSLSGEVQSSGNIRLRLNEANAKDFYVEQVRATLYDSRIGVSTSYEANAMGEVLLWYIDAEGFPTYGTTYTEGTLYKNVITDENGNETAEFVNKRGQTVMKESYTGSEWAQTYYVYDDIGHLKFVLPPEFISWVEMNGVSQSDAEFTAGDLILPPTSYPNYYYGPTGSVTLVDGFTHNANTSGSLVIKPGKELAEIEAYKHALYEYCFQYTYDDRNRMISKKVPGTEPVYMVYDQWDRLVLTQDGNQRANGKWLFTKYDILNRPVITGEKVISGSEQTIRTAVANATNRSETYNNGSLKGYSNSAYPSNGVTINDLLTVTYYDNYEFVSNTTELSSTSYQRVYTSSDAWHIATPIVQNDNVKGLVTGTLTNDGDNSFIETITYYDHKYRPIQTVSTNHLGGTDVVSNQYDFLGNLRKIQTVHSDGNVTTTIKRTFEYDHMDRLETVTHQLNSETPMTILENVYDEIGRLESKDLHEGEQEVNYTYNIRGWLTSINDPDLTNASDLFGMKLHYNSNSVDPTNTNFNGNISAMEWSDVTATGNGHERAYNYHYDQLNRLISANHLINGSNNDTDINDPFDVEIPNYDLNGNIKELIRKGDAASNMDNLTYSYIGNQLLSVSDTGNDEGFKDGNTSGNDYAYDDNGNMILDKNKDITFIEYNHLNLPIKVQFTTSGDYIEYLYDAAGIKLQQKVYENSTLVKTTDYVGEFIYETPENGSREIALIQHEEGRIIYDDWGHDWDYQYHLKDHLGNVRVTFSTLSTDPLVCKETFETGESNGFQDLHRHTNSNANTTSGGNEVERLEIGQTGAMALLAVNRQDTIFMNVNVNYVNAPSGNNHVLSSAFDLFTAVNSAYGIGAEGGPMIDPDQSEINTAISTGMSGKDGSNGRPKAFLNYILFDDDMNYIKAGFQQISTAAQGIGVHENISINNITPTEDGYILAYLSNENQETFTVHFDDFYIEQRKTNIVSTDDYYPFGLTFNSYQRTASKEQNFLYNQGIATTHLGGEGKTFRTERIDELGIDMTKYRMYDYAIGRFMQVDPLADAAAQESLSPYHYVRNNPINYSDPYGDCDWCKELISSAASAVASYAKNVAIATGNAIKEGVNDFVENSKVELKTEMKISEKIGAKGEVKGVGGVGAGLTISEDTYSAAVTVDIKDGAINSGNKKESMKGSTLELSGQVGGNGASAKIIKDEKGDIIGSEGQVTTSTGIPAVQTETTLKMTTNETEFSSGVSGGATTPLPVPTTNGFVPHISVGISLKLIYNKKEEND